MGFFRYLERNAPCPHCHEPLRPEDIHILHNAQRGVIFEAKCRKCQEVLQAYAGVKPHQSQKTPKIHKAGWTEEEYHMHLQIISISESVEDLFSEQ